MSVITKVLYCNCYNSSVTKRFKGSGKRLKHLIHTPNNQMDGYEYRY